MYTTGYHATGYYATPYFVGSVIKSRWTYYGLIQEVRQLLGDDNPLWLRYSDQQMVNTLNRGLYEVARIRPDAFYDLFFSNNLQVPEVSELIPTPAGTVDWLDAFALDLRFYPPLTSFVMGMILASEDANFDTVAKRRSSGVYRLYGAEAQLAMFRRHLLSV